MAQTRDVLAGMLVRVPLFEELSKKELQAVLRCGSEVEHAAGRTIVSEGSEGAVGFHLILQGRARVLVNGRTRRHLGPGEFFGEIALLDGGPRSASVVAEEVTRTFSITAWDFRPLLDEHPAMTRKILLELCRRLRDVESVIA